MAEILVCDDDKNIVEAIEIYLAQEGHHILKAYDGEQAIRVLQNNPVDLLIIDVMMPKLDGIRATLKIREKNALPIIILSAKSEDADKILGLNVGADDYVTKPYRVKELLSRIAANLRRYRLTQRNVEPEGYHFGQHCFYPKEFRLYRNGELVDCTPNDLRLLGELIAHEGQVLERGQILERLFDAQESFVDDNTLSVYMKRLRCKLGEDAEYIETVRGVGYRFTRKETGHGK